MKIYFVAEDALTRRVRELAEPVCAACGVDCYLVEIAGQRSRPRLRVFIDAIDGVNVDDCAKVSRQLSAVLDVENPIRGAYTLEVSSPGLDRPLRNLDDLQAHVGEKVYLETAEPIGNRRRFSGMLTGIDGESIEMSIDGHSTKIPALAVRKAHLQHSFDNH